MLADLDDFAHSRRTDLTQSDAISTNGSRSHFTRTWRKAPVASSVTLPQKVAWLPEAMEHQASPSVNRKTVPGGSRLTR